MRLLDVLAVLLVAEGVAQSAVFVERKVHGPGVVDILRVDPASGLRIPVASAATGTVSINTLGFRGPEIPVPKPDGVTRLAFLGGSTTFGLNVSSNRQTWPNRVIDSLRDRFPDRRFDYVNAGVPGFTTRDSRIALATRVAETEPDIIVIYHAVNDLLEAGTSVARADGFEMSGPGAEPGWLARNSVLAGFLDRSATRLWRDHLARDTDGKVALPAEAIAEPFSAGLEALVADAARIADSVVVVAFATRLSGDRLSAAPLSSPDDLLYYLPMLTADDFANLFEAQNAVIREVASRAGIPLVAGEGTVPADDRHFTDTIHFTDEGSRWMARRVSATLAMLPVLH